MLNKKKKSKRFSKRINSNKYKIESIRKVRLSKNDVLVISIEQQLSDAMYKRLEEEITQVTKHEKILIIDGKVDIGIIKSEKKR